MACTTMLGSPLLDSQALETTSGLGLRDTTAQRWEVWRLLRGQRPFLRRPARRMTVTRPEPCELRWRCRASPTVRVSLPQPSPGTSRGTGAHARALRGRFPFKITLVSSDPYGFRAAFPQCSAAERLGARGGAAAGIRAEAAAAAAAGSGLRRARGVGPCGCRAGRMSAAARATGASTWGTFRPTCERRTWRTCFTSTAASARSSSRTGTASCPSPSSASRIRGEEPAARPPAGWRPALLSPRPPFPLPAAPTPRGTPRRRRPLLPSAFPVVQYFTSKPQMGFGGPGPAKLASRRVRACTLSQEAGQAA